MTVTRYDLGTQYRGNVGAPAIVGKVDGRYVRYDDYAALATHNELLTLQLQKVQAGAIAAGCTVVDKKMLQELRHAHQIIKNALSIMTLEQKEKWAQQNHRDGCDGEGTTRANERDAVISKLYKAAPQSAAPHVERQRRGEPAEGWKSPAAQWLREKALKQQATNEQYPKHAESYPSWGIWVNKLNWLADELLTSTPQPAEPLKSSSGLLQEFVGEAKRAGIESLGLAHIYADPASGDCDYCGCWTSKLADGACQACHDRYHLNMEAS